MLTIDQLSSITGVNKPTLRYYEQQGLIKSYRKENNYRYFDDDCDKIILTIRQLTNYGLTLQQVRSFIYDEDSSKINCLKDKMISDNLILQARLKNQMLKLEYIKHYNDENYYIVRNCDELWLCTHLKDDMSIDKVELHSRLINAIPISNPYMLIDLERTNHYEYGFYLTKSDALKLGYDESEFLLIPKGKTITFLLLYDAKSLYSEIYNYYIKKIETLGFKLRINLIMTFPFVSYLKNNELIHLNELTFFIE